MGIVAIKIESMSPTTVAPARKNERFSWEDTLAQPADPFFANVAETAAKDIENADLAVASGTAFNPVRT